MRRIVAQRPADAAEGVDLDLGGAVDSAQEAVVLRLDPRLPDAVTHLDAAVALVVQLLPRDLADGPEQVRTDLSVRVLAYELALDLDPLEAVEALEHVGRDLVGHVGLDRRGRERQRLEVALGAPLDPVRLHAQQLPEPLVDLAPLVAIVRELVRAHHEREPAAVVHQHVAVAVDDLAARRLHLDLAHDVAAGLRGVLVA